MHDTTNGIIVLMHFRTSTSNKKTTFIMCQPTGYLRLPIFYIVHLYLIFQYLISSTVEAGTLRLPGNLHASCDPWKEVVCVQNDRPIIGVLAQEYLPAYRHKNGATLKFSNFGDRDTQRESNNKTIIAASYVKWIESGGGRAVPIFIDQDDKYYENLMTKINGLLIPGGIVSIMDSGYARAGRLLYNLAREKLHQNGVYFPIWGTCLGFELLTVLAGDGTSWLTDCKGENISLPLNFQEGAHGSRILRNAPRSLMKNLSKKNLTANSHHFCLTPTNFTKAGLGETLKVLATSNDLEGKKFIAMFEAKQYPIYGVQWHPEKNNFEWRPNANYPHGDEATAVSQYFANFFISEARKNANRFATLDDENEALIYNWNPTFSPKTAFVQTYFFPQNITNKASNLTKLE